jgi:hypothetical protein
MEVFWVSVCSIVLLWGLAVRRFIEQGSHIYLYMKWFRVFKDVPALKNSIYVRMNYEQVQA